MPERRRNTPLWLLLFVRRLRSPEGRLAPLAVIAIAVSVTLATGLEMSSRSAQKHLDTTAESITGAAKIEIVAGDVGLAEEILEVARATPGVRAASPLVSVKLRIADRDFALNVIGVDLLAEEVVRKTVIERHGLEIRDPLRLLAGPSSVVVTEALLDRLDLGDDYREGRAVEIPVRANGRDASLSVQGVLRPTGIAAAFSGQVAVMDVYAAQILGGRAGMLDRIDIVPEPAQDVPALISALGAKLSGRATVQRSSARSRVAEDLLGMVKKAALILSGAAALVACLLTYATTAQWVERQRRQLATLRAVGMEARRVERMILAEVTLLAVIGTALGIAGGVAVSPPLLATLSEFLEVVAIERFEGVSLAPTTLWIASFVGLGAGITGGALPARRAASRFSLDSLDREPARGRGRSVRIWVAMLALTAFALLFASGSGIAAGSAMVRLGALLFSGILAILALAPHGLGLLRFALRPLQLYRPAVGHLTTRLFRMRPWTFAISLTAIASLVGTLLTVFLLIATVRSAFERWAESRFPGDPILVLPFSLSDPIGGDFLSSESIAAIRATPGVVAVSEQYKGDATILFRGQEVPLVAMTMSVVARHGHIPGIDRRSADLAADLSNGAVAVSPGFVKAFGLGTGDSIELDTSHGVQRFEIAGLYEDFGETTGSILLDIAAFDRHWKRPGASIAVAWTDSPSESVVDAIRRRAAGLQDLYFASGRDIVAVNRRLTQVFSSTLQALGAFMAALGAIGVMVLLTGIVSERRRDLAVLRAAGAEPRQLVEVVLVDAFALGAAGAGLGVALGFACAEPAADILRESFGWILEQRWTAAELPALIAGAVIASVLGAALPALSAYRTASDEVVGPE
ncbi:MAG: FtsX-like permease family protein [Deltaproteobacteria bacterium]|nr:FtsX-like permease family protein [Deltaproteobacteria bacterium]